MSLTDSSSIMVAGPALHGVRSVTDVPSLTCVLRQCKSRNHVSRIHRKIAHGIGKQERTPIMQHLQPTTCHRLGLWARLLTLFVVAHMVTPSIFAQGVGLVGGLTVNNPSAQFRQLGSFPSCCPEFTDGSGIGGQFGGWLERPLGGGFSVIGRLMVSWDHVGFTDDEASFVADLRDTPRVVPALFRHELTSSHAALVLEPLLALRLFGRTSAVVGPRLALGLSQTFRQTETLIEPADFGSFAGSGRVWIDNSGDIPQPPAVAAAITGGVRTSIEITADGSMTISPELTYSYSLTDVSQGATWKNHALRIGASIGWLPRETPPVEPGPSSDMTPPPLAAIPDKPVPPKIRLRVYGINDDGTIIADPIIDRREIKVTNLHPMLGHVYFGDASWQIPERYLRGTERALLDTLTLTPIEALHGELAIIALRMRIRRQARLKVGGMVANTATDKGADLARKRAEAVIEKLISLGIESDRIELITGDRLFPATKMSDTSERMLAIEENRRVEISCNDEYVMAPITLGSIDISVFPKRIRVADSVESTALRDVQTDLFLGGKKIPVARDNARDWATEDVDLSSIVTRSIANTLSVKVSATDTAGQSGEETLSIPIRHQDTAMRRKVRSGDLFIERYGLVLFDFNTANIGPHHMFIINIIKSRITPTTTVSIFGMTDKAGSDDYNRTLSQRRAREVARMLGVSVSSVEGLGEDSPQFPNDLPEGRAANRTVVVELRTKVP
ncbi:MAG: hypothetical protein FGM33_00930 [Candidatus Kapabacteria bacterium]|nr:hypothetical protein [Candidatus Kapabacteria bacterium]